MKYWKWLFIICLVACSEDEKVENSTLSNSMLNKNGRLIGIDLLNLTETNSFQNNLDLADELGVEFIALHRTWSQLEPIANSYNDPDNAMQLLSQTAVANNYKFSLTIRPIDLVGKTVPTDLANLRFNDTTVINRFNRCLNFVFSKVDVSNLLNLQIGNEIDGYDTSNEPSSFWSDYIIFLDSVNRYVKHEYPGLKVGYTGTLKGLNENPIRFNSLLEKVDLLGVTYYPIKNDFTVKTPSVLNDDLDALLSNFTSKPIYLQELGYQSGEASNSNEQQQEQFFDSFLNYWDKHSTEIVAVNIVRLNDLSLQDAQSSAIPYGISDTVFIDYLRTLGLRTNEANGENKMVFESLSSNLRKRGW